MKTNVSIELSEVERDALATRLDGKYTKRLATRSDITELVIKLLGGFLEEASFKSVMNIPPENEPKAVTSDLYRIRAGEEAVLRGKPESYIRGWNAARTDGR
jgi:hypothetical protein